MYTKLAVLFFNSEYLFKDSATRNNSMYLLHKLYYGRLASSSKELRQLSKLKNGNSFLLNFPALYNCNIDVLQKQQYLLLASKRNFADYLILNNPNLDLSLYPEISIDKLKNNPLLTINNNLIIFKFESTTKNGIRL